MLKKLQSYLILSSLILSIVLIGNVEILQAQSDREWHEGVIRIKLAPDAVSQMSLQSSEDVIATGIETLNSLNAQFNAVKMEAVFPTNPRFAERHKRFGLDRWFEVQFDSGVSTEEIRLAYANVQEIEVSEHIYEKTLHDSRSMYDGVIADRATGNEEAQILNDPPNDPLFGQQWHYQNDGQSGGTAGADISLLEAWGIETGSSDVIIQIVDSGIDENHEDLQNMLWINPNSGPENGYDGDVYGWNFADGNTNITDSDGHGTHVSGTVAAENENGIGLSGVAGGSGQGDGVRLMIGRTFGDAAPGGFAEAIVYGADNGAVISQNSWGYRNPGFMEQALTDAIDYFIQFAGYDENGNPSGPIQGGIVVFAAGNSNSSADYYPGFYEPVFAVAASNHNDGRAPYSNYGSWVDITAPGGQEGSPVISTLPGNNYGGNFYYGTSMAAPHVSGVLGLVASKYPNLTNDEVMARVMAMTDNIDAQNPDYIDQLGSGRINAFRSLEEDDGVPPAAITNLAQDGLAAENFIALSWTAPGSSNNEGQAFQYDLRYSTSPITAANFETANQFEDTPIPSMAGETDQVVVTGLVPKTEYYFAIKTKDVFSNVSDISNVVTVETDGSPAISVSDTLLSSTVQIGSTQNETFTITNTGEGLLSYTFPSYANGGVLTTENGVSLKEFAVAERTAETEQTIENRLIISHYLNGTLTDPTERERVIISDYERERAAEQSLTNETLLNEQSVVFEFESLEAAGGEFYDVTDNGYSGNLTAVAADFVINSSSDNTYANDFAVLFTTSPEINESTVVLQVGGLTSYGPDGTRIAWDTGGSDDPGTPVQTVIDIPTPLDLEDLHVFIGHGWDPGGLSSWSGSIELVGAVDQPTFVSAITPASGSLAVGESVNVDVTFDATEIVAGYYEGSTSLRSNDLDNPSTTMEFTMQTEGGAPDLVLSESILDFGNVFQNNSETRNITFSNNGTAVLEISSLDIADSNFSLDLAAPLTITPGESETGIVTFTPSSLGSFNATLTVVSDDPAGDQTVTLTGNGTQVPSIALNPEQISTTLQGGEMGSETFDIVNNGEGPLDFSFPGFLPDEAFTTGDLPTQKATLQNVEAERVTAAERYIIDRFLSGNLSNPTDRQQEIVERYKNNLAMENGGESDLLSGNSVSYEFEDLILDGAEFSLLNDGSYSGELTQVAGNFVLNSSEGFTWANDLAILFIDGQELSADGIVLQVGGTTAFNPDVEPIGWGMGGSSSPGTPVDAVVDIPTPLDVSGLSVWIGNGWGFGGPSSWSGMVELIGVSDTPNFITGVSPISGTVNAGESITVTANFDATDFLAGTYESDVLIESNDPQNPIVSLGAVMNVEGNVAISVDPDSLNFGSVFEATTEQLTFDVVNSGNGILNVTDITIPEADFVADTTMFEVAPFSSETVTVSFTPTSVGTITGTATVTSSDSDNPTVSVLLIGEGVDRPEIAVNPQVLNAAANSGETTTENLTILNNGDGPLEFSFPGLEVLSLLEQPGVKPNNTERIYPDGYEVVREARDTRVGHPVLLGAGGPDEFGYSWIDSNEPGGPAFNWVDISEIGDEVTDLSGTWDGNTTINLPFNFPFYDGEYTEALVSVNGWIHFGDYSAGGFTNLEIPSAEEPNNLLAVFWDDLDMREAGAVYTYHDESSGNFIVQWENVPSSIFGGAPAGEMTFQAILNANGIVTYQYFDMVGDINTNTVGIENADGTDGLQVAFNTDYIENNLAVRFSTVPSFLSVDIAEGTIGAGQSQDITVTFNAGGLNGGIYESGLSIASNDPFTPMVEVATTFDVTGTPMIALDPAALNFDPIFVGETETKVVAVTNPGTDVLEVSSVAFDDPSFSADVTQFNIAIGGQQAVLVTFDPAEAKDYSAEMTITSNADGNETVTVPLSGTSLEAPVVSVDGTPISFDLAQNESASQTLTITNSGGNDLVVNLSDIPGATFSSGQNQRINNKGDKTSAGKTEFGSAGKSPYQFADQTKPFNVSGNQKGVRTENSSIALMDEHEGTVVFHDDFEDYDDFALNYGDWTLLDEDGAPTYGFQGISFPNSGEPMAFIVFNPAMTAPPLTESTQEGDPMPGMSKYLASFAAIPEGEVTNNDDWMITPQVALGNGSEVSFYVRSFTADFGLERYRVGVSTTGITPDDFTILTEEPFETAPFGEWTKVSYDLSDYDGEQVNVAINVVSEDAFIFMLDDFKITSQSMMTWLDYTPQDTVIAPGESVDVLINADASGIAAGSYERMLVIESNDPATPEINIPVMMSVSQTIGWANLQWPAEETIAVGESIEVYGQVYAEGITESDEPHSEMTMWVGVSSEGSHPGNWSEEAWTEASFNTSHDNNHEYVATIGSDLEMGTYYYATRFQFADEAPVHGGYSEGGGGFWEEGVNTSGILNVEESVSITEEEVPVSFTLDQNYPNPFNPSTSIRFGLPEAADVTLEVFNMLGQRVSVLVSESRSSGYHTINFDASDLSSGVYIYRIQAGSYVETRKLTLIK